MYISAGLNASSEEVADAHQEIPGKCAPATPQLHDAQRALCLLPDMMPHYVPSNGFPIPWLKEL
jgi:hypothetical protein